jgi:hypothetical protein
LGRLGASARRGATTSIGGSAVTLFPAGAGVAVDEGAGAGVGVAAGVGVCDSAVPPMQSISEAPPQLAKNGFANPDIIPILKAAVQFVVNEFDKGPAVDIRRADFNSPDESLLYEAANRHGTISQSRSGDRGSAGLKGDAGRVQVGELGVGGQV